MPNDLLFDVLSAFLCRLSLVTTAVFHIRLSRIGIGDLPCAQDVVEYEIDLELLL